jgi:hypothetical protein
MIFVAFLFNEKLLPEAATISMRSGKEFYYWY